MSDITYTITGTIARHTITVRAEPMNDAEFARRVNDLQAWEPDNHAEFKTLGAATGWLKKLLKKPGWPYGSRWEVVRSEHGGIQVFNIRAWVETFHATNSKAAAWTKDGGRTWHWLSNNAPCPLDACQAYGIQCQITSQRRAVEEHAAQVIADYRERMQGHTHTAEELSEMRSAFGAGAKVVNVITGQITQL